MSEEIKTYKCIGCSSNLGGRISCLDGKDIDGKKCSDMNADCLAFTDMESGVTKDWKGNVDKRVV
jgi:hypothetical protein